MSPEITPSFVATLLQLNDIVTRIEARQEHEKRRAQESSSVKDRALPKTPTNQSISDT